MKPALVLGLALAANAMVADSNNELFVAPTGKFGDHAQRFQGKIIMYDEVADDELAVALAPRSVFKSDEEYKKAVYSSRYHWDDAADDELGLKIVHLPTAEPVAFDDDELWGGIGFDGKGTPSFGRKFDPKQWKSPQGQYPKLVADDELAIMIAPRSRFSSDEEYEKYKISMRRSWDDAADDELIFNPPQFLSQNPTDVYGRILRDSRGLPIQPLPARFDEVADDELRAFANPNFPNQPNFHNLPKDEFGNAVRPPITRFDEVADDELGLKIVQFPVEHVAFDDDELGVVAPPRKPRSSFSSDEEYQKYLAYKRAHRNFDDAADDEFAINQQIVQLPAEFVAFDDDELMSGIPPVSNFKSYEEWLRFTRRMSEEADNELGVKYVHLPVEHVAFDDDEFYVPIVLAKYDEVADDELAYLGHLLNERAHPRSLDESKKAEKPSHGKTKERTQMKRKFRPVVDETPLAQI